MTTLRAHFDGRVLVPDEPVNLPQGRTLELVVREVGELKSLPIKMDPVTGLPYFEVPPGTPSFTSDDVRRAMDDE